jgi:hypothetical protein
LTFDTDYATGDDLRRLFAEHPIPGRATLFLHAPMPGVDFGPHEIEPHPIFKASEPWEETLTAYEAQFPGTPRGLRPHSCATSHMLGIAMKRRGYLYSSVSAPMYQAGLRPYRQAWGVYELPIYYMDNMDYCMAQNWPGRRHEPFDPAIIRRACGEEGLYVFDFHPIHLLMNTCSQAFYERARRRMVEEGATWGQMRHPCRGAATFFDELCGAMRAAGLESVTCLEVAEAYDREACLSPKES